MLLSSCRDTELDDLQEESEDRKYDLLKNSVTDKNVNNAKNITTELSDDEKTGSLNTKIRIEKQIFPIDNTENCKNSACPLGKNKVVKNQNNSGNENDIKFKLKFKLQNENLNDETDIKKAKDNKIKPETSTVNNSIVNNSLAGNSVVDNSIVGDSVVTNKNFEKINRNAIQTQKSNKNNNGVTSFLGNGIDNSNIKQNQSNILPKPSKNTNSNPPEENNTSTNLNEDLMVDELVDVEDCQNNENNTGYNNQEEKRNDIKNKPINTELPGKTNLMPTITENENESKNENESESETDSENEYKNINEKINENFITEDTSLKNKELIKNQVVFQNNDQIPNNESSEDEPLPQDDKQNEASQNQNQVDKNDPMNDKPQKRVPGGTNQTIARKPIKTQPQLNNPLPVDDKEIRNQIHQNQDQLPNEKAIQKLLQQNVSQLPDEQAIQNQVQQNEEYIDEKEINKQTSQNMNQPVNEKDIDELLNGNNNGMDEKIDIDKDGNVEAEAGNQNNNEENLSQSGQEFENINDIKEDDIIGQNNNPLNIDDENKQEANDIKDPRRVIINQIQSFDLKERRTPIKGFNQNIKNMNRVTFMIFKILTYFFKDSIHKLEKETANKLLQIITFSNYLDEDTSKHYMNPRSLGNSVLLIYELINKDAYKKKAHNILSLDMNNLTKAFNKDAINKKIKLQIPENQSNFIKTIDVIKNNLLKAYAEFENDYKNTDNEKHKRSKLAASFAYLSQQIMHCLFSKTLAENYKMTNDIEAIDNIIQILNSKLKEQINTLYKLADKNQSRLKNKNIFIFFAIKLHKFVNENMPKKKVSLRERINKFLS